MMSPAQIRTTLVALTALGLVLATWLFLSSDSPPEVEHAQVLQPHHTTTSAPPADSPSDPPLAQISTRAFEAVPKGLVPTDVDARIEPSARHGRLVTVVDRETKQPVPGALVMYGAAIPPPALHREDFRLTQSNGFVDMMLRDSRLFRTNQLGTVRIGIAPGDEGSGMIAARKANRFGHIALHNLSNDDWRIEISPIDTIEVVVSDGQGRPVEGVEVGVRVALADEAIGIELSKACSDASGLVIVPCPKDMEDLSGQWETSLSVGISLPLAQPVSKPIDLNCLPSSPIRLTLPPTKPVTLRVRHRDGSPAPPGLSVSLAQYSDFPSMFSLDAFPLLGTATSQTNQAGEATFPRVGELNQWIAKAWTQDLVCTALITHETSRQSPIPDVLEMTWDPDFITFTARLLLDTNRPLSNTRVRIARPGLESRSRDIHVDDDGYAVFRTASHSLHERSIVFRVAKTPPLEGSCTWPEQAGRHIDLGEVQLECMPTLVSGSVLNPDGSPGANALVTVRPYIIEPSTNEPVAINYDLYSGLKRTVQSDACGSFVLYGDYKEAETVQVFAHRSDSAPSQLRVTPKGSEDVSLSLRVPASVTAKIKVPKSPAVEDFFSVRLISELPGAPLELPEPTLRYALGELEVNWRGIPQGPYLIEVTRDNLSAPHSMATAEFSDSPRLRLSNVPPETDGLTTRSHRFSVDATARAEPTIVKLDLTQNWVAMGIQASNVAGKPIPAPHAEVLLHDGSFYLSGQSSPGSCEVLVPKHCLAVRVFARGFAPKLAELHTRHQSMTLFEAPEIKLVLTEAPAGTYWASASLTGPTGVTLVSLKETDLAGEFVGTTTDCAVGEHSVVLEYVAPGGDGREKKLCIEPSPVIQIRPGPRPQEFRFRAGR